MTETQLINKCIKGDSNSQKSLFEKYTPMLFMVSLRYARSREDAEDALQESWVKIFNSLESYQSRGKFEAWMKTIVINTALRNGSKAYFKNEKNGFEYLVEEEIEPSVVAEMSYNEIMEMVNQLPDGYAQVFKLAVIDDFKHKEIAALLNIAESTSRVKLTLAKRKLQKMVNDLNNYYVH
jgi:RNA polymerase sigma-70 factor (ECF subfamily)